MYELKNLFRRKNVARQIHQLIMTIEWHSNWRRARGRTFGGGQGDSFVAINKLTPSQRGFVKMLRRPRDPRARRRFVREVTAYETLGESTHLPALYEHNASTWKNRQSDLYLVLEYIDGHTLDEHLRECGALAVDEVQAMLEPLFAVLERCHREGIIHRDIKPKNIVLRGRNPSDPVLVDFGLSFNSSSESDDLTRVGEEVGNRFLRLPEHSIGGRSNLSDLTQLAGIALYSLTGIEPRVLLDDENRMPHQRERTLVILSETFSGRQLLRIRAFCDRAFAIQSTMRFQTINDLREEFNGVFEVPSTGDDEYKQLMSEVDEISGSAELIAANERRRRLEVVTQAAISIVQSFASQRGLQHSQSGYTVEASSSNAEGSTLLALFDGEQPLRGSLKFERYRFVLIGPEIVFLLRDEELWRGENTDDESFRRAITTVAMRTYLRTRGVER